MDQDMAIGVSFILIVAACVASWRVGDAVGAARTRRLYRNAMIPHVAMPAPQLPAIDPCRQTLVGNAPPPSVADDPLTLERKRRRLDAFATMPPLDDLRAQAELIRLSECVMDPQVWFDPALGFMPPPELDRRSRSGDLPAQHPVDGECPPPDGVLRQYRTSIHELHRSRGNQPVGDGDLIIQPAQGTADTTTAGHSRPAAEVGRRAAVSDTLPLKS